MNWLWEVFVAQCNIYRAKNVMELAIAENAYRRLIDLPETESRQQ